MDRRVDGKDDGEGNDGGDEPARHSARIVIQKDRRERHDESHYQSWKAIHYAPQNFRVLIGWSLAQRSSDQLRSPALYLAVEDDVASEEGANCVSEGNEKGT